MAERGRAIICVEDPGAANFVAELPVALRARGVEAILLAYGPAHGYLRRRDSGPFAVADGLDADALLDHFQPSLVVIGTSENRDTPVLRLVPAAARRAIPSVGVVDSPASSARRFRGTASDPLAYAPDWLLVPDGWSREQYVELGYPEQQVVVCGHPHYDFVREFGRGAVAQRGQLRESLYPRAAPDATVVVFAADLSTGLDQAEYQRSDGYTLHGRGASTGRTEIVLEEFLDAVEPREPRPFRVLRLHPKNELGQFAEYLNAFDQVSQQERSLEVIVAADAVVGMTTMLLLEAVLLGTPTLSIIPRALERGWLASTHGGLTPCATTRAEVRLRVDHLLDQRPLPDPRSVAELFPPGSLGRAANAIVASLAR